MKRRAFVIGLLCLVGLCNGSPNACGQDSYSITDLRASLGAIPSHPFSRAWGINNRGQAVGDTNTGTNGLTAWLYSGGVMTDLGITGWARAVNDSGQIVGRVKQPGTSYDFHAFLYSTGVVTDLGTLNYGNYSSAFNVNNIGQVVGEAFANSMEDVHAFLYTGGGMLDLGTLGGYYSKANSINNLGQVVGRASTSNGVIHAFLYSGGVMTDLGALLGGGMSEAYDINDHGQVVGEGTTTNGDMHAFLYTGGAMVDLCSLSNGPSDTFGAAYAINNLGQVVGTAVTSNGEGYPFLYSGGVMTNLNDLLYANPGWAFDSAYDINDKGQILCRRVDSEGQEDFFLLTPQLKLHIVHDIVSYTFSWPTNWTGCGLYRKDCVGLGCNTNWVPVTNVPVIDDRRYKVTIPALEMLSRGFFRVLCQ